MAAKVALTSRRFKGTVSKRWASELACASLRPHQPDNDQTDDSRTNADHPQGRLRRLHDGRHCAFGMAGKRGKDQALDHEYQPKRSEEVFHTWAIDVQRAAGGDGAGADCALPDGLLK